jgi:hypothetical protein
MFTPGAVPDPPQAASGVLQRVSELDVAFAAIVEGLECEFDAFDHRPGPRSRTALEAGDTGDAGERSTRRPASAWSDPEVVDEIGRLERLARTAAAQGYRWVAELAARRPAPSDHPDEKGLSAYAVDEVAVGAGLSRYAACARVAEADAFVHRHPRILDALEAGLLASHVARRVLDATATLDQAGCEEIEKALLDRLGRPAVRGLGSMSLTELDGLDPDLRASIMAKATTAWVGRAARALVTRLDPEAAASRQTKARTERRVIFEPGDDGMGWLGIHLPNSSGLAAVNHIDGLAHSLVEPPAAPADPTDPTAVPDGERQAPRSMDAKRADVATALLLGQSVETAGSTEQDAKTAPPINLHLILDAVTHPPRAPHTVGEAGRLGPVTVQTVRELLALAESTGGSVNGTTVTDRLEAELACPGAEAHRVNGPGPHRPGRRLAALVRARYRTCVFPGCLRPSRDCQLDHKTPWPLGPTCECNLAPLCVHHHQLKHHAPGWTLTRRSDGRHEWRTPTGRCLLTGPEGPDPPDDPDPPGDPGC